VSIIPKITQTIAQVMPAGERDELMDAHRVLGKPIDRVDGRAKVTGEAPFTAEIPLEGLVHAALAYSTIPKGVIRSIDISAAERLPGVLHVLTHENAPRMQPPPLFDPGGGTDAGASDVNVLNTNSIVYDGQPIALVIADTIERAEHAASAIHAVYEVAPAELSFDKAKAKAKTPEKVMGEETKSRTEIRKQRLRQLPIASISATKLPDTTTMRLNYMQLLQSGTAMTN
jgi:xanthine dehydrogenase YagR molybdenum-binding subunit